MNEDQAEGFAAVASIVPHEGWIGAFTTRRYSGALFDCGARVVKIGTEAGDLCPNGTLGTVLGSIGHPKAGVGYFVEWDTRPRHAVMVVEHRLSAVLQ